MRRAVAGAVVVALLAPGGMVLPERAGAAASLGVVGMPAVPDDNVWHADVSRLPKHPRSAAFMQSIGTGAGLHADFGSGTWDGGPIGIPYMVVPASQPKVPVRFDYAGESDPGPYPIPPGRADRGRRAGDRRPARSGSAGAQARH